jgi:hypothetical protein
MRQSQEQAVVEPETRGWRGVYIWGISLGNSCYPVAVAVLLLLLYTSSSKVSTATSGLVQGIDSAPKQKEKEEKEENKGKRKETKITGPKSDRESSQPCKRCTAPASCRCLLSICPPPLVVPLFYPLSLSLSLSLSPLFCLIPLSTEPPPCLNPLSFLSALVPPPYRSAWLPIVLRVSALHCIVDSAPKTPTVY